jgi:Ca2+-binding RTX toxin-like protein
VKKQKSQGWRRAWSWLRGSAGCRRRWFRPALDVLEDRIVLSGGSVNGGTGDVLDIDLPRLFPGHNTFTWDPSQLTVDGIPFAISNSAFSYLTSPGSSVPADGHVYFAPDLGDSATGHPGFQGTITCNLRVDGLSQSFSIVVVPGYSSTLGNAVTFGTGALDIARQQQRLEFLGFPDRNGNPISLTGQSDAATQWATSLFYNVVHYNPVHPQTYRSTDAFLQSGAGALTSDPDGLTEVFINAPNAPRWVKIPDSGPGFVVNPNANPPGPQSEQWATSWASDLFETAAANWQNDRTDPSKNLGTTNVLGMQGASLPQGGPHFKPSGGLVHASHQAGMDIDISTYPSHNDLFSNGMINTVFFQTYLRAADNTYYIRALDNAHVVIRNDDGSYAAGAISDAATWTRALTAEDAWDEESVLQGIEALIISPPGYSVPAIRQEIAEFYALPASSEGSIVGIYNNDPRMWDGFTAQGQSGTITVPAHFVSFSAGHGGHFHVRVRPPVPEVPLPQQLPPLVPDPELGTPGNLTPGGVENLLINGLNNFINQFLGGFSNRLNLPPSNLPLLPPDVGTLFNLTTLLQESVPQMNLAAVSTMGDLESALTAAGFTVDQAVDDLTTLDPQRPADLIRVSRTYALPELTQTTAMTTEGTASLQDLEGDVPSGNLSATGDFQVTLNFGVDTGGFYLVPGAALTGSVTAAGDPGANIGNYGDEAGAANVVLGTEIDLATADTDGRLRLADLGQDFGAATPLVLSGTADMSLGFEFDPPANNLVEFGGQWQWQIGGSGFQLDASRSGFDNGSLLDSLVGLVAPGMNRLADEAGTIGQLARQVPIVGSSLAQAIAPVANAGLATPTDLAGVTDYLNAQGFQIESELTPRDFLNGAYRTKDFIRLRYVHTVTPLSPITFQASGQKDFTAAGVDVGLELAGNLSVVPAITFNLEFGLDDNGPFLVQGGGVTASLPVSGELTGSAHIGSLINISADAQANLGASVRLTLDTGDGKPGEKLYLSDFDVADVFDNGPPTALTTSGTLGLALTLSAHDPAASIPIVGQFLPANFTWHAAASIDLLSGDATYNVDTAHMPDFGSLKDQLFGNFVNQLEQYDPIPKSVRDFLVSPIQFLGDKSMADLAGLHDVSLLIAPDSFANQPSDSVAQSDEGDTSALQLHFDFEDPANLANLLTGRPVNLISVTIDKTFDAPTEPITVLPPTLLYSFFGLINFTGEIGVEPEASIGFHMTVGLDTSGFYVQAQHDDVFTVSGGIQADATLRGEITVVPVAQVTVGVGVSAFAGIGLESPRVNDPKIRGGDLFNDGNIVASNLHADLGVDMNLHLEGRVGLDTNSNSLSLGASKDLSFQLFRIQIGGHQPGAQSFEDFKNSLIDKGKLLVCGAAVLSGGSDLLADAGCALAFAGPVIHALEDAGKFVAQQVGNLVNAVGQVITNIGHVAQQAVQILDQAFNKFVSAVGDIINGVGQVVDYVIGQLGDFLFGSWQPVQITPQYTFAASVVAGNLVVTANGDAPGQGAHLTFGATADGQSLIIEGPAFTENLTVATRHSFIFGTQTRQADVTFNNTLEVPLAGINVAVVTGTSLDDQLLVSPGTLLRFLINGAGGNDLLVGGDGNDTLIASGSGSNTLVGGPGDDSLVGGSGNDTLIGGTGNDTLLGGAGDDYLTEDSPSSGVDRSGEHNSMDGGPGNDTIIGSPGNDTIVGGPGNDTIYGGAGDDSIVSGPATLPPGETSDQESDYVDAGPGNDTVYGGAGNDLIIGGPGNNELHGGAGDDTLYGSGQQESPTDGNNTLYGDAGSDVLVGGSGDDCLVGGTGADLLRGGSGNDFLEGDDPNNPNDPSNGNDLLYGEDGNDTLVGGLSGPGHAVFPTQQGQFFNVLDGGEGDDKLIGGPGSNYMNGGPGNDTLTGGPGNDTLIGFGGSDSMAGMGGDDYIVGAHGPDSMGGSTIDGGDGNDTIIGSDGPDSVYGGNGNDLIDDPDGNNWIDGGPGNDTITAGPGNDFINGGPGNDLIYGGAGQNTIYGGAGSDTIYAAQTGPGAAPGSDPNLVYGDDPSALTVTTPAPWGDLIYGGTGNDTLYGGAGNDTIYAVGGDDLMAGLAGDDQLYGGSGQSVMWGGGLAFTFDIHDPASFMDFPDSGQIYHDGVRDAFVVARITPAVTGGSSVDGLPTDGNDTLVGGPNTDWLFGGGGNDVLYGGAGDDYVDGGAGNDLVHGGDGNDIVRGGSGSDTVHGDAGIDQVYGDNGSPSDVDLLYGDAGDAIGNQAGQRLWGGSGQNYLYAYAAVGMDATMTQITAETQKVGDELHAGTGPSWLYGNLRQDVLIGGANNDFLSGDYLAGPNFAVNTQSATVGGADYLSGGGGNNLLYGGGGSDTLVGGSGSDWLDGQDGHDLLVGGTGTEVFVLDVDPSYQAQGDQYTSGGGLNILYIAGTAGNDVIKLSQSAPGLFRIEYDGRLFTGAWRDKNGTPIFTQVRIDGLDGNDDIEFVQGSDPNAPGYEAGATALDVSGMGGANSGFVTDINGGPGNDTIVGTAGRDRIEGGSGSDLLYGMAGDDRLYGDDAASLGGDPGADADKPTDVNTLYGGQGDDDLFGGRGVNLLYAWTTDPRAGAPSDKAATVLGLIGGQVAQPGQAGGPATLVAAQVAALTQGLNGIAHFTVQLGSQTPVAVIVPEDDKATDLGRLVADLAAALQQAGLAGEVTAASDSSGRVTLTTAGEALGGAITIVRTGQFGVFVDGQGKLHADDGGGQYQLENTGLNRVLGGPQADSLYGGTGLDFLDGNPPNDDTPDGDVLYKSDGTPFTSLDNGLVPDWKAYAQASTKVWYYSGTNADDVINVDYVTEPGLLHDHNLITRLTNNGGNYSFDAQVRLDFDATNSQGNLVWDANDLALNLDQIRSLDPSVRGVAYQQLLLDGGLLPPEGSYDAIVIDALGGNDTITVGPTVTTPVWVDGGPGNDTIRVLSGNPILTDKTEQGSRNDTPDKASPLTDSASNGGALDSSIAFRGLTIDNRQDVDWYSFRLGAAPPSGAAIQVGGSADTEATVGHLSATLYAADATTMIGKPALNFPDSGSGPIVLGGLGLTAGTTYLLKVESPDQVPTIYDVTFSLDGSTPRTVSEAAGSSPDRRDILIGGTGDDTISGGAGEEWIIGGPGNNVLTSGPKSRDKSLLFGGPGDDTFQVIPDTLPSHSGRDTSVFPLTSDEFYGGGGNDRVIFLGGDLDQYGRPIPDDVALRYDAQLARYDFTSLVWDTANQRFLQNADGTYQHQYAFYQTHGVNNLTIDTRSGDDEVHLDPGYKFPGESDPSYPTWGISPGDLRLGALPGSVVIDGGPGNDRLFGGPEADSISGGDGSDVIIGGGGSDTIDGGAGDDFVTGGTADQVIAPDRYKYVTVNGVTQSNSTPDFAANLGAVTAGETITGLTLPQGDPSDWYVFPAPAADHSLGLAQTAYVTPDMIQVPEVGLDNGVETPTGKSFQFTLTAAVLQNGTFVQVPGFAGVPAYYMLHVEHAYTTESTAGEEKLAGRRYQIRFGALGSTLDVSAGASDISLGSGSVSDHPAAIPLGKIDSAHPAAFIGTVRDYIGSFADYAALPSGFSGHPADTLAPSYATVYLGTSGSAGAQFDGSSFTLKLPAPVLTPSIFGSQCVIGSVGDYNGDGLDDIVVAVTLPSIQFGQHMSQEGVYILFGRPGGFSGTVDVVHSADVIFTGFANPLTVASAGKLSGATSSTGHEVDDLLVGESSGGNGRAYLFRGRQNWGAAPVRLGPAAATPVPPGNGAFLNATGLGHFTGSGNQIAELQDAAAGIEIVIMGNDLKPQVTLLSGIYGLQVVPVGDVDGDGLTDLVLTGVNEPSYLVFGGNLTPYKQSDGYVHLDDLVTRGLARLLPPGNYVGLGDVNGDGHDDLGATALDALGSTYWLGEVFYGDARPGLDFTHPAVVLQPVQPNFNLQNFTAEFFAGVGSAGSGPSTIALADGAGGQVHVFHGLTLAPPSPPIAATPQKAQDYSFDLAPALPHAAAPAGVPGINLSAAGSSPPPLGNAFALTGADLAGAGGVEDVGDVTGDGVHDFVVQGSTQSYLLPGPLDLHDLAAVTDRAMLTFDHSLGVPAQRMGDVNGDGVSDLVFVNSATQTVYMIYGGPSLLSRLLVNGPRTLTAAMADRTISLAGGFDSGETLSAFALNWNGDINAGTGLPEDDILISSSATPGYLFDGAALVNGSLTLADALLTLSPDSTDRQQAVQQLFPSSSQFSASAAPNYLTLVPGDVNGDGLDDIVIADSGYMQISDTLGLTVPNRGRVYLIPGQPGGPSSSTLSLNDAASVMRDDYALGGSLSALGDLNGDGYADFAVGRTEENARYAPGGLFVFYGSAHPTLTPGLTVSSSVPAGETLVGPLTATAGDFNGDGKIDLAVAQGSATLEDAQGFQVDFSRRGQVGVFWSAGAGTTSLTLDAADLTLQGEQTGDQFGLLSSTPDLDLNDDGISDLTAGAVERGKVYVIYGSTQVVSLPPADQATLLYDQPIPGVGNVLERQAGNQPITFPGSLDGPGDAWYRYTTVGDGQAGDQIRVLPAAPQAALLCDLYDASGVRLAESPKVIDLRRFPAGTYYLRVHAGAATSFGIEVRPPAPDHGHPDPGRAEIHGGDGDDFLVGNGGADRLYGDSGSDQAIASPTEVVGNLTIVAAPPPVSAPPPVDEVVTIPDPGLRAAVAHALGLPYTISWQGRPLVTAPIYASQMAMLTAIDAHGFGIKDLTGVQYATNLESLNLANNLVSDLTPLAGLSDLNMLALDGNRVSDLRPLTGLTALVDLSINGNRVSDLALLSGLTQLRTLSVNGDPRFAPQAPDGTQYLPFRAIQRYSSPAGSYPFGSYVAGVGDNFAVGNPFDSPSGFADAGSVTLFDGATGVLSNTVYDPGFAANDQFGYAVTPFGNDVLVSAPGTLGFVPDRHTASSSGSVLEPVGVVYLLDPGTGAVLRTFNDPAPRPYTGGSYQNNQFGYSMTVLGNTILIGAPASDAGGATQAGTVYAFDGLTGRSLGSLSAPAPTTGDEFGWSLAAVAGKIAVGALGAAQGGVSGVGAVYVFQGLADHLPVALAEPSPVNGDQFGRSLAAAGDNLVVGAPGRNSNAGAAYIFDGTGSQPLDTLTGSAPSAGPAPEFGASVAGVSGDVLVGTSFGSSAYLFRVSTGDLVHKFIDPNPGNAQWFGWSVAAAGTRVIIGAPHLIDQNLSTSFGTVYLYDGAEVSDLGPLEGLNQLQSLSLSGNQITNVAPLAALTNLTSLDLSANHISDASPLAALPHLTSLNLQTNPLGTVSGRVWNDPTGAGGSGSGQAGVAGWTVYLDLNNNGHLDPGEPSTATDAQGNYAFSNLAPGAYTVAELGHGLGGITVGASPTNQVAADVNPASQATPLYDLTLFKGSIYFAGDSGDGNRWALWRFDGHMASLVTLPLTGQELINPYALTVVTDPLHARPDVLYFIADAGGGASNVLWSYDGTTVSRVNVGTAGQGGYLTGLTNLNGTLYFATGGEPDQRVELWRYDGSKASLAATLIPPNGSGYAYDFTASGNSLFFLADVGDGEGAQLWRFDGSTAAAVTRLNAASGGFGPGWLTDINGTLYLTGDDGSGSALWRYNSSTNTVSRISGTGGGPGYLSAVNGILYFDAYDSLGDAHLWQYDGHALTKLTDNLNVGNGGLELATPVVQLGTGLYFSADGGTAGGQGLWRYQNGTATKLADSILTGDLTVFDGAIYYSLGGSGSQLWRYAPPASAGTYSALVRAGQVALQEYASSVIGFSSQFSATRWSAAQALGAPDTFDYADLPTAWAPLPENGSQEYLTVGFDTPVYANGVTIRETIGNGFVTQVDVVDTSGALHTVWTGTDPSQPGSPADNLVTWPVTPYLVKGVKIHVDTNHNLSTWEEIDAVQLQGFAPAQLAVPGLDFGNFRVLNAGGDRTANEGSPVHFAATVQDPNPNDGISLSNFAWDFGDHTTATGLTADHAYADNGTYAVSFSAKYGSQTYTDTLTVTVNNVAPTATLSAPSAVNEGTPFTVSWLNATDPSSADLAAGLHYVFALDVASLAGVTYASTSASPSATLTIPDGPSTHTLVAAVIDKDGGIFTTSVPIVVKNVPPQNVTIGGAASTVNEGDLANLTGGFSDPGSLDTHTFFWHVVASNGQAIGDGTGPTFSFTPATYGTYTVTLTVTDKDGGVGSTTLSLPVHDLAPTVHLPATANATEAGTYTAAGSFTDPGADVWTATANYGDGSGDQPLALNPDGTFVLSHAYTAPGAFPVTVKVNDGSLTGTRSAVVTVANVAPTISLIGAAGPALPKGSTYSAAGSFADPGTENWTATVNYGDGTGDQPLTLGADKSFALSHVYRNAGAFRVTVKVGDGTDTTTVTAPVTVSNLAPAVNLLHGAEIVEGGTYTESGSFSDPGAENWTATVDYGDGSGPQPLALNADKSFALSHVYAASGLYSVMVDVSDGTDGGSGTALVTVDGQPPRVQTSLNQTLSEGSMYSSSGSVTEAGSEALTLTANYGDGSGWVPVALNGTTFGLAHDYARSGVYPVTLSAADSHGAMTTAAGQATVVNVVPSVIAGPGGTAVAGGAFTGSGSFTDPGAGPWKATVNYGDGSPDQPLPLNADKTFALGHVYAIAGTFQVTVRVADDAGAVGQGQATVTVMPAPVGPTIVGVGPVAPGVRRVPVTSVDVTLAAPIDPTSFTDQVVSLTRNGGPSLTTSVVTVTQLSDTTYRVGGLAGLTGIDGAYVLTVDATGLRNTAGTAGTAKSSAAWVMDTTAPTATIAAPAPTARTTPASSLQVTFSEPVTGFGLGDLAFTLNGRAAALTGATLTTTDNTTFTLAGLAGLNAADGSYALSLVAAGSGVQDQAGNALAAGAATAWVVDTTPPISAVKALPVASHTASFAVSWSGTDGASGSGIATYTVYVSDNGGGYGAWLTATPQTSATYPGQDGHTYAFYSIATDNAGNVQLAATALQTTAVAFPADHLVMQAPGQTIAGGRFTVTVKAVDPSGFTDLLYNGSVALLLSKAPAGGKLTGTTTAAVQNGVATFRNLSFNVVGGSYTLLAASTSDLVTATSGPITVAPTTHFTVTGAPGGTPAGQSVTVTVTALDGAGHRDRSYVGAVHFTSTDPQAVLPPDYTFRPVDHGQVSFAVTLKTAGNQSVAAADVTSAASRGTSGPVAVAAGPAVALGVTGYPSPDVRGVAHNFVVTALDAYGNRATTYRGTVRLTSTDPSAAPPTAYPFGAADGGSHTFSTTFSSPGVQSLTATDSAKSTITGSQSGISVVSPAVRLAVAAMQAAPAAGQSITVTVTALEASGHADGRFTDTVRFTSTDPQAVLPPDYPFTSTDQGTRSFTVTLKTAGLQTITATDVVRPAIKGSAGGTVSAGAAATLSVSAFPIADVSGVAHPVIVTTLDAYGNKAGAYRGTVQLSSTDAAAALPAAYPFTAADGGSHTFSATLFTQGAWSLTATDAANGAVAGTEPGINVVSPATHLGVAGTPTTAGQPSSLTVTALDNANRADGLFQDVVHFTSSDPLAVLPPDYLLTAADRGKKTFTVTLETAGTPTVTATDVVRPTVTGTSAGIPVAAGAATALQMTGYPSPTLAGTTHNFTVTAIDAFGNRATGYRGTVQVTSSDGQTPPLPLYPFTTADNGAHTFSAGLATVGNQTLTANNLGGGAVSPGQLTVNVAHLTAGVACPPLSVPGQPLTFTLSAAEDGQPAGTLFSYRIDWDGNATVDQTVSGPAGLAVIHTYAASGIFPVKVTVADAAGNVSPQAASQTVAVRAVALEPDPGDATKTALFVGGTAGNDAITIAPADATGLTVSVSINGATQPGGPFGSIVHIVVFGQGGSDSIQEVAATFSSQSVPVRVPALLFAGSGNTVLSAAGSSAANLLVGGAGNDTLTGGSGSDVLIGGGGASALHAGGGGDILLAGSTTYAPIVGGVPQPNLPSLLALLAEWGRKDVSYQARVQDLFAGGGLNGGNLLNPPTVLFSALVDQIFAGTALDWLWFADNTRAVDQVNNPGGGIATFG